MNVLIVDEVHDILIQRLKEKNFTVDYKPHITFEEALQRIVGYEGIIIRSKFKITQSFIEKGNKLQFIARVGAGMENIDTRHAQDNGIHCFNSPEGNRDAVGEQALGMLLSLLNKLMTANDEVKKGIWNRIKNRGLELKNKTVGIIGYGNMGSAFAEKLRGIGCEVIAYDKYKFRFSNEYVKEATWEDFLDKTDVLSLHVPLTGETQYMVDDTFIRAFRKPIYLLNTARGGVVKTADLVKNLKRGKVLGAALDVLEFEKSSFEELHGTEQMPAYFNELIALDNVILSPHVAGWTEESNLKISEVIAKKILETFSG